MEPELECEREEWLLVDLEDDLDELLREEDDLDELLREECELELCLLGGMGNASLRQTNCLLNTNIDIALPIQTKQGA